MKFTNTYKIISIVLSLLVLFSTLSLTIEKHFCGNVLIDVAIFSESEKCNDDLSAFSNHEMVKESCCKDEIEVIKGFAVVTINSFDDLETIQKHVLIAYAFSYINFFGALSHLVIPHKDYSPPIRIEDIQALDETYLI